MAIGLPKVLAVAEQALDYRAIRQNMIASNIANVDTPFYRPRDIDFESHMQAAKRAQGEDVALPLAQSSEAHLTAQNSRSLDKAVLFFRDGHMARNDANSVDIDVESTELAKNSMMFKAVTAAMKKELGIYVSVIESSKRLS